MPTNASILSDVSGNLAVGAFGSAQTIVSGSKPAGIAVGGINGNGVLTPLALDAYGSLTVRPGVCPTWTASSGSSVATGTAAGKCMLSIVNNSSTTWARLVWFLAQCPPQANTTGGLLGIGSGTSYTQIPFALHRITGHSGGTALTKVSADPTDDNILDADCTVRVGAATTGKAASPSYVWDAAYNGSVPMGPRPDMCVKVHTIPPGGNGLGIYCQSALSTSVGFLLMATCSQNSA